MKGPNRRHHFLFIGTVAGLALLCLGWTAYRRGEEAPLLRAHCDLMALLVAGDFEQAYRLTTEEYQARHTVEEFRSTFRGYEGDERNFTRPSVLSLGLSSAEVYAYELPGYFEFLNGPSFFYRKERGQWRFTGETAHSFD